MCNPVSVAGSGSDSAAIHAGISSRSALGIVSGGENCQSVSECHRRSDEVGLLDARIIKYMEKKSTKSCTMYNVYMGNL